MRTATFKSVLDGAAVRLGVTPGNLMADQAAALTEYIGTRLKDAWELYDWPFTRVTEERVYRPRFVDVVAATILAGEILFHLDAYWEAVVNGPTDAPGALSAQWKVPVAFARFVLAVQPGKTEIGEVTGAWTADPTLSDKEEDVAFLVGDERFDFMQSSPVKVWLRFTRRAPRLTTVAWSGVVAYVAGDLVYSGLDCFVAAMSGTNQLPPVSGSNSFWTRQGFPDGLAKYAKLAAVADCLNEANQHDKGARMEALATDALEDELEKIFSKQLQMGRFGVVLR